MEPERFDDEPRVAVYDCECEPDDAPCGECIVCLSAKLEETEQERDAAEAKARAFDALVEMRGELGWHVDLEKWWLSVPYGIDANGLVCHDCRSDADPIAVIAAGHETWVKRGRPLVAKRSADVWDSAARHIEDCKLRDAEEIKARRAKEADRG